MPKACSAQAENRCCKRSCLTLNPTQLKDGLVSEQRTLNLAERRAIAAYQEETFNGLKAQMIEAVGKDITIDVEWAALALPDQAERYSREDFWTNIFFVPTVKALSDLGADAMGKEALQGALQRIVFTYDEATAPSMAYENGVSFADGTLTINFKPFTNADYIDDRATAIVKELERKL